MRRSAPATTTIQPRARAPAPPPPPPPAPPAAFPEPPQRAGNDDYPAARRAMLERDLRGRGIKDQRVLARMDAVPRHLFVPEHLRGSAYADRPLPIGEGQTISQPYIVAFM